MEEILEDYTTGAIQFRDKWQFELKTELLTLTQKGRNKESQEFYFFIPNALQINDETYKKNEFYADQTSLIRFKTPSFRMDELLDEQNPESPFVQLHQLLKSPKTQQNPKILQNEVKLLGDIFRSSLRDQMIAFTVRMYRLKNAEDIEEFQKYVHRYLDELVAFKTKFREIEQEYLAEWPPEKVENLFNYVKEFINLTRGKALTQFLHRLRQRQIDGPIDSKIVKMLSDDYAFISPVTFLHDPIKEEFILHRESLLNKFVLDPLLLKTSRSSTDQRYKNIIAGLPAAIAMLVYMTLFVWGWSYFVVNSQPFIVLTVIIYVLKDRIKEELRILSYKQAARWFSDYTTEIHSNGTDIGTLRESFAFVPEEKVDPKILKMRDREFHGVLEGFKRPEQIIYYKKTITLNDNLKNIEARFYGINLIFRFDVHHFLTKAEDAYQQTYVFDPETKMIKRMQLPRVYHINIVIKTTLEEEKEPRIDKFRLIVDKNGIKRVENLTVP